MIHWSFTNPFSTIFSNHSLRTQIEIALGMGMAALTPKLNIEVKDRWRSFLAPAIRVFQGWKIVFVRLTMRFPSLESGYRRRSIINAVNREMPR